MVASIQSKRPTEWYTIIITQAIYSNFRKMVYIGSLGILMECLQVYKTKTITLILSSIQKR